MACAVAPVGDYKRLSCPRVCCRAAGDARTTGGLAQVRKVALDNRREARNGRDPRRERVPSFDKAQQATCAESQPRWSESGRLGQKWRQTMRDYVLPKIGAVPVDAIEARHVKRVLAPLVVGKANLHQLDAWREIMERVNDYDQDGALYPTPADHILSRNGSR